MVGSIASTSFPASEASITWVCSGFSDVMFGIFSRHPVSHWQKLLSCRVLIAAGAFSADVDRLPFKNQSELYVARATPIKSKAWSLSVVPHFFLSSLLRLEFTIPAISWMVELNFCKRVGETIKRKGEVSQACLGKSTSFILDIHNRVNWQLTKQDSHWPVPHDNIAGSCANSSSWRD